MMSASSPLRFLSRFQTRNASTPAAPRPMEAPLPAAPAAEDNSYLRKALDLFEKDVLRVVATMTESIGTAKDKSGQACENLGDVQGAIDALVQSSSAVDEEVSGIARSGDELTRAANEISSTVDIVRQRSASTMQTATQSAQDIEGLASAVNEIGALLSAIGEIATRTNLLALNATIEAARAGEAGRGFAVVAGEVKALSVAAAQSVAAIRQRMEALQASSRHAIGSMKQICAEIGDITPVCETIAQAAEEQRNTISDLAQRMGKAQQAVRGVSQNVLRINDMTISARKISNEAGALSQSASLEAGNLGRRVVTILRSMHAADRRMSERFPIDLALRIRNRGDVIAARSFDLSAGGLLIRPGDALRLTIGQVYEAEASRIGTLQLKVVNVTANGTHCSFEGLTPAMKAALDAEIATFQQAHAPLITRAQTLAAEIQTAVEAEIAAHRLSEGAVFDTDYRMIAGTDPAQFTTRYLESFDAILPAILERHLCADASMVFCLATDRNGYIPVHNRKVSHKQRPGEREWNTANCRNRRIFDDRAGLLAGRLMKPFLIQTYNRDMGNGVLVQMKEVDAPLLINGQHWGGVRMAYKL